MNMKSFKFELDSDNKWYIVLPEWKGDKADLEMVCGADTMLDIIAQERDVAYLSISEEPIDNCSFTLSFIEEQSEGGLYYLKSEFYEFEVWLCHVTKFVFGGLPKTLYCKHW